MKPHEILNIAIDAQKAGDQGRVDQACMWLDIYLGRTLTDEDELLQRDTFGDSHLIDGEAKLWLLERELAQPDGEPDPGEEMPENDNIKLIDAKAA